MRDPSSPEYQMGALLRRKKKLFEKLLIQNVYLISGEEGLFLFFRCNAIEFIAT